MQLALLKDLKKYYGERLLLDIDKFELLEGDRIGLVGENGVGKSTLIKILLSKLKADEGKVFLTDSYSYISQRENLFDGCNESKMKKIFNTSKKYEDYLSGGEKVKVKLVKALEENRSLIIADEPTSNLDGRSIELLDNMLKNYNGSLLLVSHDRGFLNDLCNVIAELEDGKLKIYKGNYNDYINLKEANYKKEKKDYIKYIHEKNRLEKAINQKETLRDRIKKAPKEMGKSEAKTVKMGDQRGKKNIDNNIKSIKSRIDHLQIKEAPKKREEIIINITPEMKIATKAPIEIRNLNLFAGEKLLISIS